MGRTTKSGHKKSAQRAIEDAYGAAEKLNRKRLMGRIATVEDYWQNGQVWRRLLRKIKAPGPVSRHLIEFDYHATEMEKSPGRKRKSSRRKNPAKMGRARKADRSGWVEHYSGIWSKRYPAGQEASIRRSGRSILLVVRGPGTANEEHGARRKFTSVRRAKAWADSNATKIRSSGLFHRPRMKKTGMRANPLPSVWEPYRDGYTQYRSVGLDDSSNIISAAVMNYRDHKGAQRQHYWRVLWGNHTIHEGLTYSMKTAKAAAMRHARKYAKHPLGEPVPKRNNPDFQWGGKVETTSYYKDRASAIRHHIETMRRVYGWPAADSRPSAEGALKNGILKIGRPPKANGWEIILRKNGNYVYRRPDAR